MTPEKADAYQLAIGKLAAASLREDPSLLQAAIAQIEKWKKRGAYYSADWDEILARADVDEILAILESDTQESQELRSSMPFIGPPFFTCEQAWAVHR